MLAARRLPPKGRADLVERLDLGRKLFLAAMALSTVVVSEAQSNPVRPGFDVASVKPAANANGQSLLQALPGRLRMTNLALRRLILNAYGVQDYQISGDPPWIASEHYDIQATAASNTSVQQMEGPLLQVLLEERFKLALHRETRQLPVYDLAVGKGGGKLQRSKEGSCTPYLEDSPPPPASAPGQPNRTFCGLHLTVEGLNRTLDGKGVTMAAFAASLSRTYTSDLGRTVIDRTGLTETFDVHLKWSIDPLTGPAGAGTGSPPDLAGPSLFTALQEQLGLRLESTKGPVEVLVIDHIEKPSDN
jgi:uncharacterized protein (TIGR03435 family)